MSIYVTDPQGVHVNAKYIQRMVFKGVATIHFGGNNFDTLVYRIGGEDEATEEGKRQGKGNTHRVMMSSSEGRNHRNYNNNRESNQENIKPEVEA